MIEPDSKPWCVSRPRYALAKPSFNRNILPFRYCVYAEKLTEVLGADHVLPAKLLLQELHGQEQHDRESWLKEALARAAPRI